MKAALFTSNILYLYSIYLDSWFQTGALKALNTPAILSTNKQTVNELYVVGKGTSFLHQGIVIISVVKHGKLFKKRIWDREAKILCSGYSTGSNIL